ncbi:MAG: efflux transporter outer membrane subunit [Desulfobacterales bacterium]|nr:efflux transporter outer membrane subunit [Desulfobacterales bacterium]
MPKTLFTILGIGLIAVCALSCQPFAPPGRIAAHGPLPETYSLYTEPMEPGAPWWRTFGDAQLDALIAEALSANTSLEEAWARLRQARAISVKADAALYPSLDGVSEVSAARRRVKNGTIGSFTEKNYSLGVTANYELDLWGRVGSLRQAAQLEENATREDVTAAVMTLAAEVADRWVRLISSRMDKRLLDEQLEINKTFLELIELRFRKGMVSALDVFQQRQLVENVKARIPLVEARERRLMNDLSLLLGKPPHAAVDIQRDELPTLAPAPVGLPADILANRPDVRAAGLRLRAADFQTAAARADRLPRITLGAAGAQAADKLDLIFDNWMISLAGNLAAPLVDGGKRRAEVDRAGAAADEKLAAYRRVVLTAIKEVEDALVNEVKQREHLDALDLEIQAARDALREAGSRYRKGLNDYLPVLTQLLAVQNLERGLIEKQTDLILNRITLHRALGGAWFDDVRTISHGAERH